MFAVDDDLARWEASLAALHDAERINVLLPLARHLRQRDTGRALALAQEALDLLPVSALAGDQRQIAETRVALVRARVLLAEAALARSAVQRDRGAGALRAPLQRRQRPARFFASQVGIDAVCLPQRHDQRRRATLNRHRIASFIPAA